MEIALDSLVRTGQTAMELILRTGQFFFPKVAVCRIDPSARIDLAQYESGMDQLRVILKTMALTGGPIEWIAHTADSYAYAGSNPEIINHVQRGAVKVSELFEAHLPGATEALSITVLNRFGFSEGTMVPYTRVEPRKLSWGEPLTGMGADGRVVSAMRDAIVLSMNPAAAVPQV